MSTFHTIAEKWVHFTAIAIIFFLILFEKQHFAFIFIISLLFDILHYIKPFWFPIILLCLHVFFYSSIIPTKFVAYYSQNYAGIIGSGLPALNNGICEPQAGTRVQYIHNNFLQTMNFNRLYK